MPLSVAWLGLLLAAALLFPGRTAAQESEWQRLDREAMTLYSRGDLAGAIARAREALSVAERSFGDRLVHRRSRYAD